MGDVENIIFVSGSLIPGHLYLKCLSRTLALLSVSVCACFVLQRWVSVTSLCHSKGSGNVSS